MENSHLFVVVVVLTKEKKMPFSASASGKGVCVGRGNTYISSKCKVTGCIIMPYDGTAKLKTDKFNFDIVREGEKVAINGCMLLVVPVGDVFSVTDDGKFQVNGVDV